MATAIAAICALYSCTLYVSTLSVRIEPQRVCRNQWTLFSCRGQHASYDMPILAKLMSCTPPQGSPTVRGLAEDPSYLGTLGTS